MMRRALYLISVAVPVLAGIALAVFYDRLPERWPIHWGIDGEANAFAAKSGLLVFSWVMTALGVVPVMRFYESREPRLRRLGQSVGAAVAASFSVWLSLMGVLPVLAIVLPGVGLTWVVLVVAAWNLGISVWVAARLSALPEVEKFG